LSSKNDIAAAKCLAVLGTGSEVGKSVITTALCRVLSNKGVRVAPFKAQNMSNNSGVTPDGLEMGRAQIVQAEAARIVPHVDMNPVLLKPAGAAGSQIVLLGKAVGNRNGRAAQTGPEDLFGGAARACDRLRRRCEVIVIEGAGSCAEVNLLAKDYINCRMAAHAGAPVILVADIDRGGVFAQIVGTLACLPEENQNQIKGFIINRFRGELDLLKEGIQWLEQKTGRPVFGTLPWFNHIHIEPEDAVTIEHPERIHPGGIDCPAIAIVRLPHISNFNDFEPLRRLDGLGAYYLEAAQPLDPFRAVILPGSKNTRWDLGWLRKTGWAKELSAYWQNGGHLLGICGGYQMMGIAVHDPDGIEGQPGSSQGLGLLPVETTLKSPKTTTLTRFSWGTTEGVGYEIHMGRSDRKGGQSLLRVEARNGTGMTGTDGCVSGDGRILGTYLHGMFENPGVTRRWLDRLGLADILVPQKAGMDYRDEQYDLLAAHFEKHVRVDQIMRLVN
jgi:adenosylcobyric acid synthase